MHASGIRANAVDRPSRAVMLESRHAGLVGDVASGTEGGRRVWHGKVIRAERPALLPYPQVPQGSWPESVDEGCERFAASRAAASGGRSSMKPSSSRKISASDELLVG